MGPFPVSASVMTFCGFVPSIKQGGNGLPGTHPPQKYGSSDKLFSGFSTGLPNSSSAFLRMQRAAPRSGSWKRPMRRLRNFPAISQAVLSTAPEAAEKEAEVTEALPSFSWSKQWYPVAPLVDMDPAVPHGFQILGNKVVFWKDPKSGKWSCFEDRCPHRLAPLSEGRVDPTSGCLQCSYHAWAFEADGKCAAVPQLADGEALDKVLKNPRSHVRRVYPVKEGQGLLFVWADPTSPEEAERKMPPITPGMDAPGWQSVATFRDLEYGWDTGMENLVDPSHVPVAHHNVNGGLMGKRTDSKPLPLEVGPVSVGGFVGKLPKPDGAAPTNHVFQPPARFTYDFEVRGKKELRGMVTTYCVPTSPGRCRIMVVNARNFFLGMSSGPLWWQIIPRWFDHQLMLNLLDGDEALLHYQERELRKPSTASSAAPASPERAPGPSVGSFFMPAASDKYVAAFRSWLARYGGGQPAWAEGTETRLPPALTDKRMLLDRYHQHVASCKVCSGALRGFQTAQKALAIVAVGLLCLAAAVRPWAPTAAALAFISALLSIWLGSWVEGFSFKGWDHARQ
eukprot:TRINITY_DN32506_c0_g1_i1.p1 TRINITY_DN32506_c0_g1~~TRINITY_DN32506_c0_g1_i1.p1  ORF type:complete len:566 (-),score=87.53 TRINITY_DN32506_c0_g1_i1:996-2693(-)